MPERGATPNVHPLQRRLLRRLATLSSPLLPDDYLELINPLWSTRELRGRIESIDRETRDAATVLIKPGYRWGGHQPGQYCGSASTSRACVIGAPTHSPRTRRARTG